MRENKHEASNVLKNWTIARMRFTVKCSAPKNDNSIAKWNTIQYNFQEGRGGRKKSRENPDPCQDLFGGFDIVNWGQPKVIKDPQK